jgi:hypothetical protein
VKFGEQPERIAGAAILDESRQVQHSILVNANSHDVSSQGGTSAAFSLIRLGYLSILPQDGAKYQ